VISNAVRTPIPWGTRHHTIVDRGVARTISVWLSCQEDVIATRTQRAAARRNIKKAARAARHKRTIAHLPKKTRTALSKQAAKVAKRKK
jgi:hypothetical protein